MEKYESLADALNDLEKRGYDADFEMQSNCLYCNNLDIRLYEEDFHVDEVYQFKKDADPDNNTVVYALTSPTGVKGIIIHGSSLRSLSFGVAKKLQNHLTVREQ